MHNLANMKKTRQTLKVGDIIKVGNKDAFKWTTGTIEQITRRESTPSITGLSDAKIIAITPSYVSLDQPDYTGNCPFKTTFEELERVGILDRVEEKTKLSLSVGDIFRVAQKQFAYSTGWTDKSPLDFWNTYQNVNLEVYKVKGEEIVYDFEGKEPQHYLVSTMEQLEKAGLTIIKQTNTMTNTYKKGDIFKIEKGPSISYATKDDSKDWSNGYLASGKYEIKQITKTQVYFNEERKLDSNWYIMKTKVFESIAVFDKPAETPKTKTIIGYKQVKDGLNSNIGDIFSPEGVFKLPTPFASGIGQTVVTVNVRPEKLLDTEWFTPVYEEDFKVGDWVVFQFDKAAPMYKTSVWNQNMTLQISRMEDGGKALRFDGQHPRGDSASMGNHVSCFRKATKEEIEEATTRKISNIGSKNATLILDKDGNTIKIVGKTERLFLDKLTTVYNNISVSTIGEFNIQPFSRTERLFRVGCEQEDNRVSLQEIKAVIDKFKK